MGRCSYYKVYKNCSFKKLCCDKKFNNIIQYERHIRKIHLVDKNKCFICLRYNESSSINYKHRYICFRRNILALDKYAKYQRAYYNLKFTITCCNITFKNNIVHYEIHRRCHHPNTLHQLEDSQQQQHHVINNSFEHPAMQQQLTAMQCFICWNFNELNGINYYHRLRCFTQSKKMNKHVFDSNDVM